MYYVFAPTDNGKKVEEVNFKNIIEYIGSQQSGCRSNRAKGIRYIKNEIGCSGTAVKRLYKSIYKIFNHDMTTYGLNVYKYEKHCCGIISVMLEYIEKYSNDERTDVHITNIPSSKSEYFNWIFSNQYKALKWVFDTKYKNQQKQAEDILHRLNNLR